MLGDELPSPPSEASREYLQAFLEQVRQGDLPGAPEFVKLIEETLAAMPDGKGASPPAPGRAPGKPQPDPGDPRNLLQ